MVIFIYAEVKLYLNQQKTIRRLVVYILGLFILALGVSFAIKSRLGISPVNSIPYVISQVTGTDMGMTVVMVFCVFILLQVILLRRDFKVKELLQIACAFGFGYFLTLSNRLLFFPSPESYIAQLSLMLISVLLISVGVIMYLVTELIPQPAEGLCLAIQKISGWPYSRVKLVFDCVLVAIAALVSLLGTGRLDGVREGTLIAMFGVGPVIGLLSKAFRDSLARFCMMD